MNCHVVLHKLQDMYRVTDLEDALPVTPTKSVHVEICQSPCSTVHRESIKDHVTKLLHRQRVSYGDMTLTEFDDPYLKEHVKWVAICDTELDVSGKQAIDLCQSELHLHVFQLSNEGPGMEELADEEIAAASHWLLPAADFEGIWDSLVFDSCVKSSLLHYATTTLLFSDCKVDPNIISWNRVVLLHGPPGTGKTSLCKALAQKLCIRLSDRYSYGQLIEINSHSLFSKWFSESGKLVMKMFQKIQELIDDQDALVCVLIDEVESLTAARKSSLNGTEPSDAIRVVNALLTQIDQIKRHPNVLILTTSNVTEAIDLAFVDRADIKQYIGPPSPSACFKIYHSCINELMRARIISPAQQLLDLRALEVMRFIENDATKLSLKLKEIACKSEGLSGRTLRKLPFLAHALFVKANPVSLEDYLAALSGAVDKQFEERQLLKDT
ncbi:pachytene checkpoint protein 2 homolog [Acanthaster planci]|uniref:Pachytene checkpoint protein 2 homolog n=1 Tax=Acanthaster planci TaxID=133434 RepID=A0A8B7Z480_ACAPL|nr:pachytene checkpoint protein 2 homolog [Acanthaster planci]XP_022099591.1 pachytene checkpoint protein 2 homolog [Acanthaster planci]